MIASACLSDAGKRMVDKMSFTSDFPRVRSLLCQTAEMKSILTASLDLPVDNLHDVTPYLNSIKIENSFLPADRLYKLMTFLKTMRKVAAFFSAGKDESGPAYPYLNALFGKMTLFPEAIREIDRVVDKFGEVRDSASPLLADLRSSISRTAASSASAVRKALARAVAAGIVDRDASPSIRDGRPVIPVAANDKRKFNGIIHDESATGKTVYIEPAEVVEISNRLRELEIEAHREEVRILRAVADLLRPYIDDMIDSARTMAIYDFIRAKALFAIDVDATLPILSEKPAMEWYHAVHPLLLITLRQQDKRVVPLDLTFSDGNHILMISGPNAGGKSVCLKTVAIIQYMVQCGVLPPLHDNSHVGIFRNILIDIGDEQSIENDLSTYSSHLKNMKQFLKTADKHTLFLADEMGSGTEPLIGGALAQAILSRLGESGAYGIVTTHYQNLKTFAEETPGFVNGAMLYDRQHLEPMFQLSIGTPGSSFALEIAHKTGLPDSIINNAKQIVGSDYVNMDKYLLDIARDRRYWNNKRLSIKEKEHKLDKMLESLETKTCDIKARRAELISQARSEAREILEGVNARIEKTIRDIKNAQAEKQRTRDIRKDLEEYKRKVLSESENESDATPDDLKLPRLKHREDKQRKHEAARSKESVPDVVKAGDYVRMAEGGVVGNVLSISGKKAEVAFGGLRTIVNLSKLIPAKKPAGSVGNTVSSLSGSTYSDSRQRQLQFKQELDIRGMRADEAIQAVTYFLDDAIQFNAAKVRILHGTGHGILRTLIRQQLQANTAVKSFHDEDVRFGGAGITVVDLA